MLFKQDIGTPMGIDPAPFWANLFFCFFKSKHIQNLVSKTSTRTYKYHATSQFIDDFKLMITNSQNPSNAYIQENEK